MTLRWTLLVPIKASASAKTRLAESLTGTDKALHGDLVAAMREDVLAAARATPQVARILAIVDGPGEIHGGMTIRQHSAGLNGALRDGADYAVEQWLGDGIAALVGDLPALRADELGAALDQAATHVNAYVPDADGTGTTLLTAAPMARLRPAFGEGSAARHARHATALIDVGPGLRRDVDTVADLAEAVRLGAGVATARVWALMPRSP